MGVNILKKENKLKLLFSKDAYNWSEMTVKTFIMLLKIYISNKCCSVFNIDDNKTFFLSIKSAY